MKPRTKLKCFFIFTLIIANSHLVECQEFRIVDVLTGLSSDNKELARNAESQLLKNSDIALKLLVENYFNANNFNPESFEFNPAIQKAFNLLGERAENVVPDLIKALHSNNKLLVSRAIQSIRAIGPAADEATKDLIEKLSDPHWPAKLAIAECLISINHDHFPLKKQLLNGMRSDNHHVKIGCSFALLLMDTVNPSALEVLNSGLNINDNVLRTNAIMASYHLTAKHNKTAEALDKLTPALLENFDDDLPINQKFAAIALGNIGLRAVNEIKNALNSGNQNRVYYAMLAIEVMQADLSLFKSELEGLKDSSIKRIKDQSTKLLK